MMALPTFLENQENAARKNLDKIFDDLIDAGLTKDLIEIQIRKQLDLHNLNISNFYRLRRYFMDKYKKELRKRR